MAAQIRWREIAPEKWVSLCSRESSVFKTLDAALVVVTEYRLNSGRGVEGLVRQSQSGPNKGAKQYFRATTFVLHGQSHSSLIRTIALNPYNMP